jgi:hypothetical protein
LKAAPVMFSARSVTEDPGLPSYTHTPTPAREK